MRQKIIRYLLLQFYENAELTQYLVFQAQNGYVLSQIKGNFFTFEKRPALEQARFSVLTASGNGADVTLDDAVLEQQSIALKQGWQSLCTGGIEALMPARRRMYFYTLDKSVQPLEPDALQDKRTAKSVRRAALRWCVVWLILFLLDVAFVCSVFRSGMVFTFDLLLAVLLLSMAGGCALLYRNRRKNRAPETARAASSGSPEIRRLESGIQAVMTALFVFIVAGILFL